MLRFTLPMVALLAGCAATPEQIARDDAANAETAAKLATALAGRTAGTPTNCLNTRGLNLDIYGDKLLFRSTGRGRVYVNQTSGGCFGMRRDDILVSSTPQAQFCRGDIITAVDRNTGFQTGACSYGDFVPYTRAPRG